VPLQLVMFGSGEFALPTFRALVGSCHHVAALVTQPDRSGRGHHRHVNVMKAAALAAGIEVWQPGRANSPDSLARLESYRGDIFVVAAYGQILSASLLALPRLGAINLHASLLPRYRGAAPVQYAVWNGETHTGVTIFQIVSQLDAGPILSSVETEIGREETAGELELRLAELAAPLTLQTLDELDRGGTRPTPQDPSLVTLAPKITKHHGLIDWAQDSSRVVCQIRAMQPWPMAYAFLRRGQQPPLRVLVLSARIPSDTMPGSWELASPGDIVPSDPRKLMVRTGTGVLEIMRLQPAGKRAMSAAEFLRGYPLTLADRFGNLTESPV
jgi:methionyl-tRNA formyltransferase